MSGNNIPTVRPLSPALAPSVPKKSTREESKIIPLTTPPLHAWQATPPHPLGDIKFLPQVSDFADCQATEQARSLVLLPETNPHTSDHIFGVQYSFFKQHKKVVYLSFPEDLFQQKKAILDVLKTGGTFVINFNNFTEAQHLVTLNGLLAKPPEWQGKISDKDVRIFGMLNVERLTSQSISADFISRFENSVQLEHAELAKLPKPPQIEIEKCKPLAKNEQAIDLFGSRNWRNLLNKAFDVKAEILVIRHPPQEPQVLLALQNLQMLHPKIKIKIQEGFHDSKNKKIAGYQPDKKEPVWVINAHNFDRYFCGSFGNNNKGILEPKPPLFLTAGKDVRFRLTDDLNQAQIESLFNFSQPLTLELSAAQLSAYGIPEKSPPNPFRRHPKVQSYICDDCDLKIAQLPHDSKEKRKIIDISSKAICASDLIEQVVLNKETGNKTVLPGMLLTALKNGETIYLVGMHLRPDLQAKLAGLFCETPYLIVDYQIIYLNDLKGKIVVLEESPEGQTEWIKTLIPTLAKKYRIKQERVKEDVDTLNYLLQKFHALGIPENLFSLNYRHLQLLCDTIYPQTLGAALQKPNSAFLQSLLGGIEDQRLRAQAISILEKHFHCKIVFPSEDTFALCQSILKTQRALFLKGTPGSGKSYTAEQLANSLGRCFSVSIGKKNSDEFLEELSQWANHKTTSEHAVLVIDEANLAEEQFWEILSSAFRTPASITLLGKTCSLTDKHKIIFTGNNFSTPGRIKQAIFNDCFVTVPFAPMSKEHLQEKIVEPFLEELHLSQYLTKPLLDFHHFFAERFPNEPATVRSLKNVMLRTALAKKKTNSTTDLQVKILHNAFEIYSGHLPKAQQQALRYWLEHYLQQHFKRSLPKTKKHDEKLKKEPGFSLVPSTLELANSIGRELSFRKKRLDAKGILAKAGHRAMIIEGPPGRGKDVTLVKALEAHGLTFKDPPTSKKHFCTLTAGMGWTALKNAIQQAKDSGSVIVISELNLLPANILEGELNDILTDEKAAPGFMLFATINPKEYAGREDLSEAFRNRVRYVRVEDYTPEEQLQILLDQKIPKKLAEKFVEEHQKIMHRQQALHEKGRLPSARQLLNVAKEYHKKTSALSFQQRYENIYRAYSVIDGGIQVTKTPPHQAEALALAKLLWPESPFTTIELLPKGSSLHPKILPHTLVLSEPFSLDQVAACIAVARFEKICGSPKKCCAKLAETSFFRGNSNVEKFAEQLFHKPLKAKTSHSSVTGTPAFSPIRREKSKGMESGIYNTKDEKDILYGRYETFGKSSENFYFISDYSSPRTRERLKNNRDDLLSAVSKLPKPDEPPTVVVTLDDSQLGTIFPEMPVLENHVPYVEATTSKIRKVTQWGPFELEKDEKLLNLKYSLYPFEAKTVIPETDTTPCRKDLKISLSDLPPDLQKVILDTTLSTEKRLQKIVIWIQQNTLYCDTLEKQQKAFEMYKGKKPTPLEFLTHRYGMCGEGNTLLTAIADQLLGLPARDVDGWTGEFNKISTEAHGWAEVFYKKDNEPKPRWHTLDATPQSVEALTKKKFEDYKQPQLTLEVSKSVDEKVEGPKFKRAVLHFTGMPSEQPSRQTDYVEFNSLQEASFTSLELNVQKHPIPIEIYHDDGPAAFAKIMEKQGEQIILALLGHHFKISVREHNGETTEIQSVQEMMEWGYSHPETVKPTVYAKPNKWVTSLEDLINELKPELTVGKNTILWLSSVDKDDFYTLIQRKKIILDSDHNEFYLSALVALVNRKDLLDLLVDLGVNPQFKDSFGYSAEEYFQWQKGSFKVDLNRKNLCNKLLGSALLQTLCINVIRDKLIEEWRPTRTLLEERSEKNETLPMQLIQELSSKEQHTLINLLARWSLTPEDLRIVSKEGFTLPMLLIKYADRSTYDKMMFLLAEWETQPLALDCYTRTPSGMTFPMFLVFKFGPPLPDAVIELLKKCHLEKDDLFKRGKCDDFDLPILINIMLKGRSKKIKEEGHALLTSWGLTPGESLPE